MAFLDNIYSPFDINKQINPAYSGPLFKVYNQENNARVDLYQDVDGNVDLARFASENPTNVDYAYVRWYSQDAGGVDLRIGWSGDGNSISSFAWNDNRWHKFWDGATQSVNPDAIDDNGLLTIPGAGKGQDHLETIGTVPLGIYSIFIRQKIQNPTDPTINAIVGTSNTVTGGAPLGDQSNVNTLVSSNMGTPSYYKDGVSQSFSNRGDVWTAYANEPYNVLGVVGFDLNDGRTVAEELQLLSPILSGGHWDIDGLSTVLLYTGDVGISVDDTQVTEIQTAIDDIYIPPTVASGTVSFNDVNFSNGVVDFFSVPSPTGTSTKVDSDVPITNGVATMTTERDPLKEYFGVARGMTQDFQGILASAPAGDVISTGLDLTGISIGGDNDNHYVFRATGGPGAGTEVTVKSNTGGDITVTDASAFATGTEFTLGRFVRGFSRVFPKD